MYVPMSRAKAPKLAREIYKHFLIVKVFVAENNVYWEARPKKKVRVDKLGLKEETTSDGIRRWLIDLLKMLAKGFFWMVVILFT